MQVEDDAVATPWVRLKQRSDFLRVGKGRRWHGKAMTIQTGVRDGEPDGAPRFGFTLTKKVGNSVVRNRARRRLREAVRLASPDLPVRFGHDYVIVGRVEALRVPFGAIRDELARGVAAVHTHGKLPSQRRDGRRSDGDTIAPADGGAERIRRKP